MQSEVGDVGEGKEVIDAGVNGFGQLIRPGTQAKPPSERRVDDASWPAVWCTHTVAEEIVVAPIGSLHIAIEGRQEGGRIRKTRRAELSEIERRKLLGDQEEKLERELLDGLGRLGTFEYGRNLRSRQG